MPGIKSIPGFSQGVRENAAVRMKKMAQPICPNSQIEKVVTADGRTIRKPPSPDKLNCQLAGGEWWVACEKRGHKPYYKHEVWYETVDIFDESTGELTDKKTIRHTKQDEPNFTAADIGIRLNSGNGYALKKAKGCKDLLEVGYHECCEFRGCQKQVKFRSKQYGNYCSKNHMALIAADWQEMALPMVTGRLEGPNEGRVRRERGRMLQEAIAYAEDVV